MTCRVGSVPAHRVINRKGELSGKLQFPSPTTMEERLVAEGIEVRDDKVVHFDLVFWHPKEIEA